ncbi:MAG: single-stranded DNA-binding protein [Planctomycetota bacterium]|nr:MAG: single-stranded DNA-binding protein [Planctomycetota bacterium]
MTELNKVIIIGRLTRDPEKTYTTSGMAVTKLGIAVDSGFGDRKKTAFVDVTTWNKTAEFVASYFTKGKEMLIEGRLDFDQWESKEGEKRSKLYITADRVSFVGSKADNETGGGSYSGGGSVSESPAPAAVAPSGGNPIDQLDDEDIPF